MDRSECSRTREPPISPTCLSPKYIIHYYLNLCITTLIRTLSPPYCKINPPNQVHSSGAVLHGLPHLPQPAKSRHLSGCMPCWGVRWIHKTLHDPKYPMHRKLRAFSLVRSCRFSVSTAGLRVSDVEPALWGQGA